MCLLSFCGCRDAHTWHSGTANAGEEPKGAVHLFWCRRDKPQQQHQSKLIPPAAQSAMAELPRWLCALGSALAASPAKWVKVRRHARVGSRIARHARLTS